MPFSADSFIDRQRRKASQWGLALLVLSPLFFLRSLEDAYVLPQRWVALGALLLAFAGLQPQAYNPSPVLGVGLLFFAWRIFSHSFNGGASLPWIVEQLVALGTLLLAAHA